MMISFIAFNCKWIFHFINFSLHRIISNMRRSNTRIQALHEAIQSLMCHRIRHWLCMTDIWHRNTAREVRCKLQVATFGAWQGARCNVAWVYGKVHGAMLGAWLSGRSNVWRMAKCKVQCWVHGKVHGAMLGACQSARCNVVCMASCKVPPWVHSKAQGLISGQYTAKVHTKAQGLISG